MTDSLKERLAMRGCEGCQDALARIEELEAKAFRVATVAGDQKLTIAKLEADIKDYAYNIDQYRKENATLQGKLEKAKDALKGYVDFNTEAERLIGLDDCDALARATLEELK